MDYASILLIVARGGATMKRCGLFLRMLRYTCRSSCGESLSWVRRYCLALQCLVVFMMIKPSTTILKGRTSRNRKADDKMCNGHTRCNQDLFIIHNILDDAIKVVSQNLQICYPP